MGCHRSLWTETYSGVREQTFRFADRSQAASFLFSYDLAGGHGDSESTVKESTPESWKSLSGFSPRL